MLTQIALHLKRKKKAKELGESWWLGPERLHGHRNLGSFSNTVLFMAFIASYFTVPNRSSRLHAPKANGRRSTQPPFGFSRNKLQHFHLYLFRILSPSHLRLAAREASQPPCKCRVLSLGRGIRVCSEQTLAQREEGNHDNNTDNNN